MSFQHQLVLSRFAESRTNTHDISRQRLCSLVPEISILQIRWQCRHISPHISLLLAKHRQTAEQCCAASNIYLFHLVHPWKWPSVEASSKLHKIQHLLAKGGNFLEDCHRILLAYDQSFAKRFVPSILRYNTWINHPIHSLKTGWSRGMGRGGGHL